MKVLGCAVLLISLKCWSGPKALFAHDFDRFALKDNSNKTPKFQLFKSTLTQQALALAINKYFNFSTKAGQNYVDLEIQKISFKNLKGPKASIFVQVNGRDFELDPRFLKEDLTSGKTILVRAPTEQHDLGLFQVSSKGSFQMRYDSGQDRLFINQAVGDFSFDNPLGEEERERLNFSAQGQREELSKK